MICGLLLFLYLFVNTFAADIEIDQLEMITKGDIENGNFVLDSRIDTNILIQGGYKYGGELGLSFENNDIENIYADDNDTSDQAMLFNHANVEVRDIFGFPLELSYFIGEQKPFLTGNEFTDIFASDDITTYYKGYFYFSDGVLYNGYYQPKGTGVSFSTTRALSNHFIGSTYLYQDGFLGDGYYSLDTRGLLNYQEVKIELTVGTSVPKSKYNVYRGGIFFWANAGENGSFLAQVGIPYWDPYIDKNFSTDMFYLLFEPRLKFGILSIITTLFHHPKYYLQKATNEEGTMDINFNFLLGTPQKNPVTGGLETNLRAITVDDPELKVVVSPYLKLLGSGTFWDIKFNFKAVPFDQKDFFEVFLGVRAEF
ncbi:hypothetical protein [Spirochaeta cellobiosiphila]|uniref:hypothetical protein n=1 Tax=Spirochaeta cellobiosiphila TaxID=504483 RepID=UPI000491A8E7|nr:hypothetical protein [Spirochaeta cellobiosiphila]